MEGIVFSKLPISSMQKKILIHDIYSQVKKNNRFAERLEETVYPVRTY